MHTWRETGGGGQTPISLSPGISVKPRVPQTGKAVIPARSISQPYVVRYEWESLRKIEVFWHLRTGHYILVSFPADMLRSRSDVSCGAGLALTTTRRAVRVGMGWKSIILIEMLNVDDIVRRRVLFDFDFLLKVRGY